MAQVGHALCVCFCSLLGSFSFAQMWHLPRFNPTLSTLTQVTALDNNWEVPTLAPIRLLQPTFCWDTHSNAQASSKRNKLIGLTPTLTQLCLYSMWALFIARSNIWNINLNQYRLDFLSYPYVQECIKRSMELYVHNYSVHIVCT